MRERPPGHRRGPRTQITYCCLVLAAAIAGISAADPLQSSSIRNAKERRAVCNDFTEAGYYLRRGDPQHWIVYFEGGGGCSDFSDCNARYNSDNQILMSSHNYLNMFSTIVGEDILSSDRDTNEMFYNYTHVVVPYCSSDAWLGNRSNARFSSGLPFLFNNSDNADNFVFMGQSILRAVMEDLRDHGLRNASDMILIGSSAGGVGLLNSLDWIMDLLPEPDTRVIIDSAWFISFTGHHVLKFTEKFAETLNIATPACQDLSLGYPCCVSPACLFSKGYLDSINVPILAVSSLYDIFTLERPLSETIQQEGQDDQALLAVFNGYGALMNETFIQSHNAYSQLSLYAPSCSQHVYFAPSNLWYPGGGLNSTVPGVYHESLFQLTNPIRTGNWERVNVTNAEGVSLTLLDALEQWTSNSSAQFFHTDRCSGAVCGTCPSEIIVIPEKNLWPAGYNYLVLVLSALMTLVAVGIKLSVYLYMKYLLYKQKVFTVANNNNRSKKRYFPKPTHAVNVSCTDLSYHIDLVGHSAGQEEPDSTPVHSTQHFHTEARLETFVPCYKHLCSKWYASCQSKTNLDSSRCSQVDLVRSRTRPDSGISSEITQDSLIGARKEENSESHSTSSEFDELSVFNNLTNEQGPPKRQHRKTVLNQVNLYINPGELVAIMGPSGSGKTTLLDVLLNKRTTGTTKGEILINGTPFSKMRQWFVSNTGYVRQLATYYYNELTVRENLLFSMNMQAMKGMSLKQKLERVEQVIREMGLQEQADVVVGDTVNALGLSGGQRKRLAIAVQLLSVPNILFLDEPTSGLDSASSLEILKSLSTLAETGRAVVVTIHQPRSEIFHSFDKILLLCNGQVAFFGSPIKVWDFFIHALDYKDETESEVGNSTNTADRILDHLKERRKQRRVLHAYRSNGEPEKVKCAVQRGKENKEPTPLPLNNRNPGFWQRLVALEARASLRQNLFTVVYVPIVYLVFGVILGTTYLFTSTPVQVMSVTCLLSCSSSLFMSSIIMSLLVEPLKLFRLEHSDGISNTYELVLQVFIRMSAVCTFPLAVCATLVFMLVYQNYSLEVYFIVLLMFLLVNQCWLALFILFTVIHPQQAHRLCPVFAAIGGFCCGFIVPRPLMPIYYRWIFYINPSYYAYAGTTVTVLTDNDLGCSRNSPLECFRESSIATLGSFGLEGVNPIEYMVVLIAMVWGLLLLAVAVLQFKVSYPVIREKVRPLFCCLMRGSKRQTQVHSSEAFGIMVKQNPLTASAPGTNLHPQPTSNGHPPTYDSILDLETTDAKTVSDSSSMWPGTPPQPGPNHRNLAVATNLLPDGQHSVVFTFPWERPRPSVEESDFQAPPAVQPPSSAPAQQRRSEEGASEGSREGSSSARMPHRGREERTSVRRNRRDTVVQITMEDEEGGIEEGERRKMAEEKWKQRKVEMDTELLRLRRSQQNQDRVRRHSSMVTNPVLDPPGQAMHQRRRTLSSSASLSTNQTRNSSTSGPQLLQRSSRSLSVHAQLERNEAGSGAGGVRTGWRSSLRPHMEVAEDEEEEVDLGLPPKDVPFFESEAPSALDMSQIPVEEIAMIGMENSGHWNTYGEQDSSY